MRIPRRLPSLPYFKWTKCKSADATNPDTIDLKVIGTETSDTKWSTNVRIYILKNGEWVEVILPLHWQDSYNFKLLKWWQANAKNGKLKRGKVFRLYTWLGVSKNDRRIRDFRQVGV